MRVILLNDVPKLGRRFEEKEVSGGYARNFLIPRKLAELATVATLASLEARRKKMETQAKKKLEEFGALLDSLADKRIIISAMANDEGHLFAGLHASDIESAIAREFSINAPEETIKLEHPIKEIGEHQIKLSSADKEIKMTVIVERTIE